MNDPAVPDLMRYHRQVFLPSFGIEGQIALQNTRVLVVGAGGLGCAVLPHLVGAGVGYVMIIDHDVVELNNVHRQHLHNEHTVGLSKVESAEKFLTALNSQVVIEARCEAFDESFDLGTLKGFDAILDCSDNLVTRRIINKMAFKHKIPVVSGAAIRMEGQLTVFDPDDEASPCYDCLSQYIGEQQLSCVESGILPPVVGVIGSMMALELIKLVTKIAQPAVAKLVLFDAMAGEWRHFKLPKSPTCSTCS